MFSENTTGISIELLGKQHKFSCSKDESNDLKKAANNLAVMCNTIKQNKSNASNEQTLLVASINLSYSLLMANNTIEQTLQEQKALITKLKRAL